MAYGFINYYSRAQGAQEYVRNKEKSIESFRGYMINRLMRMFKYEGLPETIPQYLLEYYLMVNGSCFITEHRGKMFAFLGSFGGEPDVYYRPTLYVVANPALKLDKSYDLWNLDGTPAGGGVLMRNDVLWQGLNPLIGRYATLLAENVITMRTADIMLRVFAMLTAPDDKTRQAGIAYLKDVEEGKLGVIGENRFFEGIKMQSPPSNNGSYLTQFIELHQFLTGSFYNEVGLSSVINMKRESISAGEASLNEESLLPLVETMLDCRKEDVSQLNDIFGTKIKVDFNSVWLENELERSVLVENLKNGEMPEEGANNGDSEGNSNPDGSNSNESESVPAGSGDGDSESVGDGNEDTGTSMESSGTDTGNDEGNGDGTGESPDTADGTANPDPVEININININPEAESEEGGESDDNDTRDSERDSDKDESSDPDGDDEADERSS